MLTFVETKLFTQIVHDYFTDEEYAALQHAIAMNPTAGDIIPGSGGVRKLRWGVSGRGKRGGVRIIYYLRKTARAGLAAHVVRQERDKWHPRDALKKIREELDGAD